MNMISVLPTTALKQTAVRCTRVPQGRNRGVPAGNHFSYSKLHRDGDIHNAGEYLYYHYYTGSDTLSHLPVSYYRVYPVEASLSVPADSAYMPAYLLAAAGKYRRLLRSFRCYQRKPGLLTMINWMVGIQRSL